jgi:hypothetical protein
MGEENEKIRLPDWLACHAFLKATVYMHFLVKDLLRFKYDQQPQKHKE